MQSPDNKTVLITGASTGIGRDAALHMDRLGWQVFAGVRKERDAQSLLDAKTGRLVPVTLDVAKQDSIDACFAQIDELLGGAQLGGVVNNAGIAVGGPLETLDLDEIRWQFEVNVFGLIAVTQKAIPMLRRGAGGRIVHVGSIAGKVTTPLMTPYCASKHAVESVSDGLRLELARWGIWSCVIEPGVIETPIWDKADTEFEQIEAKLGEEGNRLYRQSVESLAKKLKKGRKHATPAERVSEAIEHALCSESPKTRYPVGPDAKAGSLFKRLLPDSGFDWIIKQM